jgi:uncharacterized membrane protein YbhN (UPF0104 family)
MSRWPWRPALVGTAILGLAGGVLVRELDGVGLAQLHAAWAGTSALAIAGSLFATMVSFACLAMFERLAVRWMAPGRVPTAAALRIGAVAHALANTLGFHALSGGALRLREYARFGLGPKDVVRISGTVVACVATGVVALAAGAFAQSRGGMPAWIGLLALLGACSALCWWRWRGGGTGARARSGLAWVPLLGAVEMAAAIGGLYVLLPAGEAPPPATFALVYVGAMLVGIASHVPGGVGVFEAGVLAALPQAPSAPVLAALLLYRGIYNLVPFSLAALAVAVGTPRRAPVSSTAGGRAWPDVAPETAARARAPRSAGGPGSGSPR